MSPVYLCVHRCTFYSYRVQDEVSLPVASFPILCSFGVIDSAKVAAPKKSATFWSLLRHKGPRSRRYRHSMEIFIFFIFCDTKGEKKIYSNAQMAPKMIRTHCVISAEGEKLLENTVTRLGLSARAHDRILKVSRTIAGLDASTNIELKHLSEAIQYRTLDRSYGA